MSDFQIFNSFNAATLTADTGTDVALTVGPGSLVTVEQLTPFPTGGGVTMNFNVTGASLVLLGMVLVPIVSTSTQNAVANLQVPAGLAPGTYHVGLYFEWTSIIQLGLILTVQGAPGGSAPLSGTLPADTIDISVDLLGRKVSSIILPQIDGFKARDNLKFGVIPSRAGTLVGSGITEIQLALRPVGNFSCRPLVAATLTGSPVALTGSSPNQYYLMAFSLDQRALTEWFRQANDALRDATPGATSVVSLQVAAEIQFTETGPVITTSDTFNFLVFQSVVTPSPTY